IGYEHGLRLQNLGLKGNTFLDLDFSLGHEKDAFLDLDFSLGYE
ncbi:16742_t:CDS:2, partial [Funneliformis geosporum]